MGKFVKKYSFTTKPAQMSNILALCSARASAVTVWINCQLSPVACGRLNLTLLPIDCDSLAKVLTSWAQSWTDHTPSGLLGADKRVTGGIGLDRQFGLSSGFTDKRDWVYPRGYSISLCPSKFWR